MRRAQVFAQPLEVLRVIAHARWAAHRGRKPSMSYQGERNPRRALERALREIGLTPAELQLVSLVPGPRLPKTSHAQERPESLRTKPLARGDIVQIFRIKRRQKPAHRLVKRNGRLRLQCGWPNRRPMQLRNRSEYIACPDQRYS